MIELAIILGGAGTLAFLRRWYKKHEHYTLGCVFGRHENCNQHLKCSCPHHDEKIMEMMHG